MGRVLMHKYQNQKAYIRWATVQWGHRQVNYRVLNINTRHPVHRYLEESTIIKNSRGDDRSPPSTRVIGDELTSFLVYSVYLVCSLDPQDSRVSIRSPGMHPVESMSLLGGCSMGLVGDARALSAEKGHSPNKWCPH